MYINRSENMSSKYCQFVFYWKSIEYGDCLCYLDSFNIFYKDSNQIKSIVFSSSTLII